MVLSPESLALAAQVTTFPVPGRHGEPGHSLHRCEYGWELRCQGHHVRYLDQFERAFVNAAIGATAHAVSFTAQPASLPL